MDSYPVNKTQIDTTIVVGLEQLWEWLNLFRLHDLAARIEQVITHAAESVFPVAE
jgi:hypothetical protein